MSSEIKTGTTKKAKGKPVSSRYMQAAEKYSSDGTLSSEILKTQTTLMKNVTRVEKKVKVIPNKFSTPQSCAAHPAFDASAICGASGFFNTQRKNNLKQSSLNHTKVKKTEPASVSTAQKKKKYVPNQVAKNQSTKDLDDEIDILYSRYLLAVLMENKAKESLKSRCCYAMEKFQEVYQYVGLLLQKREKVEKDLNFVSYLLKVQEHLQKQETILLPILDSILTIEEQYKEIAVAAENVRHKLQTKDIDLPLDGYPGEIIQLMEKVIILLEKILQIVNNVEVISTAEGAKSFVNRGKVIADEIKRASEQLSESRDLLLSETAFKFSSLTIDE